MPPRLRKRTKTTYTEDDTDLTPTETEGSKAKKAKTGPSAVARRPNRHIRGKRGGLEGMPNMPLDVLIEIFGFIHPRDLLNLARTTREFRDFLMSRDAESFWKASRRQIEGLPEPPPGISEPVYANFLFFNHCHGCLRSGAHVVVYSSFLARYCGSCKHNLLQNVSYNFFMEILKEFYALNLVARNIFNTAIMKNGRHTSLVYHKPELDEIAKQWEALCESTSEERKMFVKKLQVSVEQRHKDADALDEWHDSVRRDMQAEKETLRDERAVAVLERLREEGWSEEVDKMNNLDADGLASLEGVNRATKLTERGWKSIRDTVFEYMEKVRSKRLQAEFANMIQLRLPFLKAVLYDYVHSEWLLEKKDQPVTYASVLDCALAPEVRTILADPSEDVTKESIVSKLMDLVPVVAAQWMEERKDEYRTLVSAALGDAEAASAPEPLDLALVAFDCHRSCDTSYTEIRTQFPRILHHSCVRRSRWTCLDDDPYERAVSAASTGSRTVPIAEMVYRASDSYAVESCCALKREVIEACGMDPNTATHAEMDACEARLRCRLCSTLARQEIHSWRTAIKHGLRHPGTWQEKEYVRGFWERLPEECAAQARALEADITRKNRENKRYQNERIRCTWCWSSPAHENDTKLHLANCHGIVEPQMDVDWFLEAQPFTVWMYSPVFAEAATSAEKALVEGGTAFYGTF